MTSNIQQSQKELYKSHLEFLGFSIEEDPTDQQELRAERYGQRILIRVFNKGIKLLEIYSLTEYAQKNRLELLEFVNKANSSGLCNYYTNDDSSLIFITLISMSSYEKSTFGTFLDYFVNEVKKLDTITNAEKFLYE